MVNLEAPSEPQRKISRQSKWDVGTVQWNPHRAAAHVFAASVSSAAVSRHSSDPTKRMRQMNCGVRLCVALRVTSGWICTPGRTTLQAFTPPCRDTLESSGNQWPLAGEVG